MTNLENGGNFDGINNTREQINKQEKKEAGIKSFEENEKLNDEYITLKNEIDNIRKQEAELLQDSEGNWQIPRDLKFDKDGNLINITVNGIQEGYGKLGKFLQDIAPKDTKREGSANDLYIVEAYKNNPQVKELIDAFAKLNQDEVSAYEKIEKIKAEKKEFYQKTSELQKLLRKIGFEQEIDATLNLEELKNIFAKAQPDKGSINDSEFKQALDKFESLMISLKDLKFPDDLKERYQIDFEAIRSIFSDIYYELSSRGIEIKDFDNSFLSKEAIDSFNKF